MNTIFLFSDLHSLLFNVLSCCLSFYFFFFFSFFVFFFFSSRRRHTRCSRDWSSDVCSSDLAPDRRHDAGHGLAHEQWLFLPVAPHEDLRREATQQRRRESNVHGTGLWPVR